SPTKTSPRIVRKEPPTQTQTPFVKYVDSVKSVAEEPAKNESKTVSRQKVKLEFQEDTVEQNRILPPRPHRVSRPPPETGSNNKTTSIPIIIENSGQKSLNNNNNNSSIKAPPNTHVIRLNVGMDDEEDIYKNKNRDHHRDRKPPPPYIPSSNRYQQQQQPPSPQTKPFTRSSKPYNETIPSSPPQQSVFHQPLPAIRQQIAPPSSLSSTLNSSSKSPKFYNTNFDTEITRL
uniref:Uncharacterized protein n=1 Tax=Panagrolaimus sp. ES5 TaxID=591445 RepID=A0AC34G979_9BILA